MTFTAPNYNPIPLNNLKVYKGVLDCGDYDSINGPGDPTYDPDAPSTISGLGSSYVGTPGWGLRRGPNKDGSACVKVNYTCDLDATTNTRDLHVGQDCSGQQATFKYLFLWAPRPPQANGWTDYRPQVSWNIASPRRELSRCPIGCRCWRASATCSRRCRRCRRRYCRLIPSVAPFTDAAQYAGRLVPAGRQTALVCGGAAGMDGGGNARATRCFRSGTSSSTRPTSRSQGRSDRLDCLQFEAALRGRFFLRRLTSAVAAAPGERRGPCGSRAGFASRSPTPAAARRLPAGRARSATASVSVASKRSLRSLAAARLASSASRAPHRSSCSISACPCTRSSNGTIRATPFDSLARPSSAAHQFERRVGISHGDAAFRDPRVDGRDVLLRADVQEVRLRLLEAAPAPRRSGPGAATRGQILEAGAKVIAISRRLPHRQHFQQQRLGLGPLAAVDQDFGDVHARHGRGDRVADLERRVAAAFEIATAPRPSGPPSCRSRQGSPGDGLPHQVAGPLGRLQRTLHQRLRFLLAELAVGPAHDEVGFAERLRVVGRLGLGRGALGPFERLGRPALRPEAAWRTMRRPMRPAARLPGRAVLRERRAPARSSAAPPRTCRASPRPGRA